MKSEYLKVISDNERMKLKALEEKQKE